MAINETYEEFVEKFKPKKTTDDCYTPPKVYEAVADFVSERYGVDKADFVRPFYPGRYYENEDYTGKIVVDNPPFSILSRIINFYRKRGIKFFLFSPTLTILGGCREPGCTAIIINGHITYENGAVVDTSFVTNMEPGDPIICVLPELCNAITQAVKESEKDGKAEKAELPKYQYPPEVLTASMCRNFATAGVHYRLDRKDCKFVRSLASQREQGKGIFGAGLLLSNAAAAKAAAAKAAAAKAAAAKAATIWELTEEEKAIVDSLG